MVGRRVYVKSAGVVSAAGLTLADNLISIEEARSCIRVLPDRAAGNLPAGYVVPGNDEISRSLHLDDGMLHSRSALLGMLAAREALDAYGRRDLGFVNGTSTGGIDLTETFYREHRDNLAEGNADYFRNHDCGGCTDDIVKCLGINPVAVRTISTACSSAANSIILASRLIASGRWDRALAGGTDALSMFTVSGFNSLRIYDSRLCRPFEEDRAGLNLGEGAGYLVLDADPEGAMCEVCGWSNVNEAYHQTGSSPDGEGPYMAMRQAIEMAGIEPCEVSYVNVHGTGTIGNDASELEAMRRLFGEDVPPFSSVKSLIGHTLAASEGIEAAFVAAALCGKLNAWGTGLRHIVSNAFGFAGNQSSIVFSSVR